MRAAFLALTLLVASPAAVPELVGTWRALAREGSVTFRPRGEFESFMRTLRPYRPRPDAPLRDTLTTLGSYTLLANDELGTSMLCVTTEPMHKRRCFKLEVRGDTMVLDDTAFAVRAGK